MKTHDLAKALNALARILKQGSDVEVRDLSISKRDSLRNSTAIAVNLTTLLELSRIDKNQWQIFIAEHDIPVNVRSRDASRDVLGKLLRYLEKNPEARSKIKRQASMKHRSPELSKALSWLLRDDDS